MVVLHRDAAGDLRHGPNHSVARRRCEFAVADLDRTGDLFGGDGIAGVKSDAQFSFPRYISDPKVWEFFGRGRGPLLNPIGNGVLIGGGLVAAVLRGWNSSRLGKVLYAVVALILLGGIYSTLTRSCWVGAIGALGCIAMVYAPRWVRIWSLACVVLLGVAMSMGLKDQLMSFKRDKKLSAVEAAKSVELRPLLAVVAWEMFKDSPIRGHGFGHYLQHNDRYHNNRAYDMPLEKVRIYVQHNTFLSVLVDGGAIGFLLFTGSLCMLALAALSITKTQTIDSEAVQAALLTIGLLVIYAANGMFHDLIVIPMVQMFLMTSAGLTVNAVTRGVLPSPKTAAVA